MKRRTRKVRYQEALISAKERPTKKKNRYKEWKSSVQDQKSDRADFAGHRTGHLYISAQQ